MVKQLYLDLKKKGQELLEGWFLLKTLRGNVFPASSLASAVTATILGAPWGQIHHSNLCPHLPRCSPGVSVFTTPPSYKDPCHIG